MFRTAAIVVLVLSPSANLFGETITLTVEGNQIRVETESLLATAPKATVDSNEQTLQLESTDKHQVVFAARDDNAPALKYWETPIVVGMADSLKLSLAKAGLLTISSPTKIKSYSIDELPKAKIDAPRGAKAKFLNLKAKSE